MDSLSALQRCQDVIDSGLAALAPPVLIGAITDALGVPGPDGSPTVIATRAEAYLQASATCGNVGSDLLSVESSQLPSAWTGDVAQSAADEVKALYHELSTASQALRQAGNALNAWSEDLGKAQRLDKTGYDDLGAARALIGVVGLFPPVPGENTAVTNLPVALAQARSGIAARVQAASQAQASGQTTAGLLTALADKARAGRLNASGLDPLDAVTLADEQNAASDGGGNVLTLAELSRASELINAMAPEDRKEFEALLARALSPAEAAYLMKALAAGNSLATIEQFDQLIHAHGNDLDWLSQHLAPDLTSDSYDGQTKITLTAGNGMVLASDGGWRDILDQGPVGDCVSASTVIAYANLDPVFMLKLTTGDAPDTPYADSPDAFVDRLQQQYIQQYQAGQLADFNNSAGRWLFQSAKIYPTADGGLGSSGETLLANSDLAQATGQAYSYHPLHGSGDNAAVLPQIQQAVDAGQPVPLDITNGHGENHQVVIIGGDGDMLEVYNPWGQTTWVPVQEFLGNHLTDVAGGQMPQVMAVELPST